MGALRISAVDRSTAPLESTKKLWESSPAFRVRQTVSYAYVANCLHTTARDVYIDWPNVMWTNRCNLRAAVSAGGTVRRVAAFHGFGADGDHILDRRQRIA